MSNDIVKVFYLIHGDFQELKTFCDERNILLTIMGNSYFTTSKLGMPNIYTLKVYEKDFSIIYNNFSLAIHDATSYMKAINEIRNNIEIANKSDTTIEEYMFWLIDKNINHRLETKRNLFKYHLTKLLTV